MSPVAGAVVEARTSKGSALKAYQADDVDGEASVIVYGYRNDWKLRREAAGQMRHGEVEGVGSVRRAPQFDEFADRPIYARDYIERGWHISCQSCDRRCESEMVDDDGDYVDEGPSYHALEPHSVWCSDECRDEYREKRFRDKVQAGDEYVRARDRAVTLWPGITIISIRRSHYDKPETLEVRFRFPGMTNRYADACWVYGADHITVPRGDEAAWRDWRATQVSPDRDPGDEHAPPTKRVKP